ncbi:MAG: ABC transporter ATP-binding protein/permease [Defluviitaleaceae bacterium]|nr:ABC transporter ATP-binding protein/permease [Defluviitaleaceae bacterium]
MSELQLKLSRISPKNFENSSFLDNLKRAKEFLEYEEFGLFVYSCLRFFTFYLVLFVSVGFYLFNLSPILILVILIAFVPAVLGQIAQIKIFSKLGDENAPLQRQNDYYKKAIIDKAFFKETRLLGGFNYFYKLFSSTLTEINKNTYKTDKKAFLIRALLSTVSFVGLGASFFILFSEVITGEISIGAFAAVFASLSQIFSIVEQLLTRFSKGIKRIGNLENYYRLLDTHELDGEEQGPNFDLGVRATDTSFTYFGKNEAAIKNITIEIKKGETLAIVGENGAGKTTLVRLLTAIYTPDDNGGIVKVGGLDTKTTNPSSILEEISGVFQNFQNYKMTMQDNVSISDTKNPVNQKKIEISLKEADFNAKNITFDTMLSSEFGGVELSGGQWQRLAIARGLYKTNQFIILDEPTSAIDPIEEQKMYNQFKELSKNKIGVIVTHRLGSVKLADKIAVMDKGKLIDIGTHDELLNKCSKYKEMWQAQAEWYKLR